MTIEGIMPPELLKPLARALAYREVSSARVVGARSGKQGTCFIIEARPSREKLILKVLSPAHPHSSLESVEREYRALELFYQSTQAHPSVGAPEPLGLFPEQMGYLMSYIDAPSIEEFLGANLPSAEDLRTIGERVVHALQLYYRGVGDIYGDFQPENVLVRPSLQVVLIDPTIADPACKSVAAGAPYSPLSADLGYWTYVVAAKSVKRALRRSMLSARLFRFTTEIIGCGSQVSAFDGTSQFSDAVYEVAERYMLRLKAERRLQARALAPLAERRLRALQAQPANTTT